MRVPTAVGERWRRVRSDAWSAGQCGVASALAWWVATRVLGHQRPFFAAVAATVALGIGGPGMRLRRTAELAFGVAMGVAVGDLLVSVLGQGTWQIGVVITIALLLAIAVGPGGLVTTQAGVQAVFVVALPRIPHSGLHRWQDALVGGAAALAVAAALPSDPWRRTQALGHRYVAELAAMLRGTADAVRRRSGPDAAQALLRGRAMEAQLDRWEAALAAGRESARISLLHRGRTPEWDAAQLLTLGLTRSSRNLRVLVRRVVSALQLDQALPVALPELLEELAAVVQLLPDGKDAVPRLVALAGRLDPLALGASNLPGQVAVAQLRVAVLDLLEGVGFAHVEALRTLPELPT